MQVRAFERYIPLSKDPRFIQFITVTVTPQSVYQTCIRPMEFSKNVC